MEVIIIVLGTLILPVVIVAVLIITNRKQTKERAHLSGELEELQRENMRKDDLVQTMEKIIDVKNETIKTITAEP